MMHSKKNIMGITLIETLMVLAIIGGIFVLSMRMFQGFRVDADVMRVRSNVEEIIRAASYYYYANCKTMTGMANAPLDPATYSPITNMPNPYTAVKVSDLVTSGYLRLPSPNSLVNDQVSGATDPSGGYRIQFNLVGGGPGPLGMPIKEYCTITGSVTDCDPIGYNVVWRIQVSVLLRNTSTQNKTSMLRMSGADCLTNSTGTNRVATCATASGASNNYLSWERLPSMPSAKGQSILWMTTPVVREFKQMNESPSLTYMLANPTVTYFKCGS